MRAVRELCELCASCRSPQESVLSAEVRSVPRGQLRAPVSACRFAPGWRFEPQLQAIICVSYFTELLSARLRAFTAISNYAGVTVGILSQREAGEIAGFLRLAAAQRTRGLFIGATNSTNTGLLNNFAP